MSTDRPFLTAEWRDLVLVNYAVEPSWLEPYLPAGCALDTLDGTPFVSVVAFDFIDTRVRGFPWPDFPEINLRFYVRQGDVRGVVFIREFVPSRLVSGIARWLYNEPYASAKIESERRESESELTLDRQWRYRGCQGRIAVTGRLPSTMPPEKSVATFFKEHQWGFGRDRKGRTLIYEVRHPYWEVCEIADAHIDIDFAGLYGESFAALSEREPDSIFLARGSAIEVHPSRLISTS